MTLSSNLNTTPPKDEEYRATIMRLRFHNFSNNLPFLILSDHLPEGQVYREYPDGHIEIQKVSYSDQIYLYTAIKTISLAEANKMRLDNGLF